MQFRRKNRINQAGEKIWRGKGWDDKLVCEEERYNFGKEKEREGLIPLFLSLLSICRVDSKTFWRE